MLTAFGQWLLINVRDELLIMFYRDLILIQYYLKVGINGGGGSY